jgi:hypothetical protein
VTIFGQKNNWSCHSRLGYLQVLRLTDLVWISWDVWEKDCGCNGCDGLLELPVCGWEGGCNGCDGLLELTVCG